jgi:hypothetical protein
MFHVEHSEAGSVAPGRVGLLILVAPPSSAKDETSQTRVARPLVFHVDSVPRWNALLESGQLFGLMFHPDHFLAW